ncbi:putative uncharacterized transmembrane protein DDB_G0290641 [Cydia pomonella]|uniref:putative uncharacterized transmembrane protein DDB_G0290641 n=1 Tax=Cydia pomonella TaxID=82600 RepID=UPI002ADD76A2|nr:putative uncharacterized transmembrane protein DDB_G0290641 [Cydia pomonella]
MPSLRTHIVLICVLAGYFITGECRNVIKESYRNNPDKKTLNSRSSLTVWLNNLLTEGKLKRIGKPNAIKALISKLIKKEKGNKKRTSKRNLRNGIEVQDFLHKLNNFINQNTHNAYYEKRKDCNFGFGSPSRACKRHKFRRNAVKKSKKARINKEKQFNNYAQHLVVERAKYKSSSSSSEIEAPSERQNSRFRIVDNKRKKVINKSSESEYQSREAYSDESDDKANEYDEKSNESDENQNESDENPNESDEKPNESNLDEDTDVTVENNEQTGKSDESENENSERETSVKQPDAKYMYLQGTRLQRPDFRTGRGFKSARKQDRLPYFLPKRYKWDDSMIYNLDTYWNVGINSYDSIKNSRT